ncbi:NAD(P)-dependent oxidoreductase [Actibacterium sp.]|uniref:NAD(P)-dependent oxidoreductase n=1 Tax=Actibacterium sp. TaxID=1872125 RepID=UPI0035652D20
MTNRQLTPGVVSGRLSPRDYRDNFAEKAPPFEPAQALVAAAQCLLCDDAPCIPACPTGVDIPLFIQQIAQGHPDAAAKTIFDQNILGGMCARVCPTEILCEHHCILVDGKDGPVEIGRLQRFATDSAMTEGAHPYTRAAPTGRRIAVVGAGPAGLSCAHRLAMKGHDVVLFDARSKAGGLNEYGVATYKTVGDFAQREVAWLTGIGGITVRTGQMLGRQLTLEALRRDYDAVFLAIGLAGVNALRTEGETISHVHDAVDFISALRQAEDLASVPVGRDVVVIGGGMTAVDAAVQAKLLGAETVTMVYRRASGQMGASEAEQHHAASKGVRIITGAAPLRIIGDGAVEAVEFAHTVEENGTLTVTEQTFHLKADQVFKAIGQVLQGTPEGLQLSGRKIAVTGPGRTSMAGVWAGGDCAVGGDDLTVTAVAQGRDAAEDIHTLLTTD